jgi:NAD(P)-dependent dehydrogenase (short-subunit alcohol dehydrogenase family)
MASILKTLDLTGKTALITGGSRGLGLQIAEITRRARGSPGVEAGIRRLSRQTPSQSSARSIS